MFLIPPLLGLVSQLVPSLIGLFAGSQAQDVAQKVVSVAQVVTGTTTQEDAHAALAADPAKATELQAKLAQIAVAALQAQEADTANARSMTMALSAAKSPMQYGALIVSIVVLALFAAVVMGWAPTPSEGLDRLLDGALVLVLGFWLGSSARSPATDSMLANSVPSHMLQGGGAKGPLAR